MGSNSALRLRRSAAQLHALAQVEREIRAADPKGRCRYLRDYAEAFPSYERVLNNEQLGSMLRDADIVLVGDYHALPASQRFAGMLLERLARAARPVLLGLEAIFARHQHVLDEWLAGGIDDDELRERIRFDLDWGYDWEPYRELLHAGRRHAQRIYGLDCMPRTDLRRIAARDRHAAAKILEVREHHPDAVLVVLFGESHLAPNHLPAWLCDSRLHLPRHGRSGRPRLLTILQNVDELYWQAAGERCDRVDAVRVRDDVVCVFNSTPLDKYESYRLCIDRWGRIGGAAPDLAPSVYNLIDALLRFLNINKYSPTNHVQPKFVVDLLPDVWCRSSPEQLERLLLRKGLTPPDIRHILERVGERGACHVPSVNAIFATSFRVEHGAEEAARFVHHACQGTLLRDTCDTPISPADAFYARTLREALAYVGSRVLCPTRPPVREADLYALYDLPREAIEEQSIYGYGEFMEMIDFLVLHKDYEANYRHYRGVPELVRTGLLYTGGKLEFVTEKLGQMLGTELYDAYLRGVVAKRFLRSLFMRPLQRPGVGRAAYYAVVRKVAKTGSRTA